MQMQPIYRRADLGDEIAGAGAKLTDAPLGRGLTVAVLSADYPDWLSTLADIGAQLVCIGAEGAYLLPRLCPDILFLDAASPLSERRTALLVAQLRWGCPDLVVVLADGIIGQRHAFRHDLNFDPALGGDHARDALAVAVALLLRRQSGQAPTNRRPPALLRRTAPRRTRLFG